jgi:hypothetical protein
VSIVITNVGFAEPDTGKCVYVVRINNDPTIATFIHYRSDGLAECLRLAAKAVDAALPIEVRVKP